MPATLVRSAAGNSGTATAPTSVLVNAGAVTSAANTLLLFIASDSTIATPAGWTLDRPQVTNTGHYLFRRAGGAQSYTIPVTAQASWHLSEVSGLTGAAPAVNSGGHTTVTAARDTGAVTPTTADTLLIASWSSSKSDLTLRTWTFNNAFVQVGAQTETSNATGAVVGLAVASKSVTALTAANCIGTYGTACAQTAIIAAYPATPAAPVSEGPFVRVGGVYVQSATVQVRVGGVYV